MTAMIAKSSYAPPKPTVQGIKEAKLVADWSKRRLKGEKVSREPPTLASVEAAKAAVPVQQAALSEAITANATGVEEPTSDRFAADPLKPAIVAAVPADAPVATTAKTTRDAAGTVVADAVPATPTPNPNAPSMTNLSDSVVPLPAKKKKPWWKIIGE